MTLNYGKFLNGADLISLALESIVLQQWREKEVRGKFRDSKCENIQKTKIMTSGPITSWQIDGETMETSDRLYFLGLQNHCRW